MARKLASLTGQLISVGIVIGNIALIMTKCLGLTFGISLLSYLNE